MCNQGYKVATRCIRTRIRTFGSGIYHHQSKSIRAVALALLLSNCCILDGTIERRRQTDGKYMFGKSMDSINKWRLKCRAYYTLVSSGEIGLIGICWWAAKSCNIWIEAKLLWFCRAQEAKFSCICGQRSCIGAIGRVWIGCVDICMGWGSATGLRPSYWTVD